MTAMHDIALSRGLYGSYTALYNMSPTARHDVFNKCARVFFGIEEGVTPGEFQHRYGEITCRQVYETIVLPRKRAGMQWM